MAPSKKSSKPAPKKTAPKKAEATPPPAPAAAPEFVKAASPAERKAALEAVLEDQGVDAVVGTAAVPRPEPTPAAVRETSPAERKAVVEALVEESGVASVLRKAPWKRPAAEKTEAAPAPAAERTKIVMTKAPMEPSAGRSQPRVVILDSNALMMQFQFHVDIEKEVRRILTFAHDIVVPSIVVKELEKIAATGSFKESAEARMAAELAKTFRVVDSPGDGDTGILRLAEKLNAVVVTNDKVLRARLRAKDIANIYMRSRAFLTLEGHIPGM